MKVFILVTCREIESVANSLMVFDTVRVGFPTAELLVVDNASCPESVSRIEAAVARVNGTLFRRANRIEHGQFINEVVSLQAGPVVFLDTDVVLWHSCEDFAFPPGTLLAGRFIPKLESETAIHLPRLHPSFLFVTDCEALRERIAKASADTWYFRGFEGYQTTMDGRSLTSDTAAAVCALIPDACRPFTSGQLDAYDHLFLGTIARHSHTFGLPHAVENVILEGHRLYKEDPASFRGFWRRQALPNVEWTYLAGRVRTDGQEYGVFVCRFHDLVNGTSSAHASVTNYTAGTYVGGPADIVSATVVEAPWGRIELEPRAGGCAHQTPIRRYGDGATSVYAMPDVHALCRVRITGQPEVAGYGDFWYEHEYGHIPPGSGWIWAAIKLDDGRAFSRRTENGLTEFIGHMTDGRNRVVAGTVHEDGYSFEGERFTLLDCGRPARIVDPIRNLDYSETYCAVFDQRGERVGFAWVESMPPGSGLPSFGPEPSKMFLRWANGDEKAAELVRTLWRASQILDDLADGDTPKRLSGPALIDLVLTGTVELQRNEFYQRHRSFIEPIITTALLFWDASNEWAVSNRRDTQFFGYCYREAFRSVILAVAYLTGGMEFARMVLREIQGYFHDAGRIESFDEWRKEQAHG